MPTYEYVCRACRHEFERFQPITSSPVRTCPKCGRKRVERKIGIGAAVLFKGGGFYETDYRSESYRKTEEAEKKETEKASEKKPADSAKPTDSKVVPAAKETDKPAEKAAAASTISESKSQASTQIPKETPAMPREKQEKKSAREGRGVGNLKQPAKTPSRASKPARKTKK
ncbi:MAG: hypothetical protein RLZZ386_1324 [Planctomycetota bacterium]